MDFKDLTFWDCWVFAALGRTIIFPDWSAVCALLVAVGFNALQKYFNHKREMEESKHFDSNFTSIQNQLDEMKLENAKIVRLAEDTQKMYSAANLAKGFTMRGARGHLNG